MNASEIYPRRVNANEVLSSQNREDFVFPIAGGTSIFPWRDYEFGEPTLGREQTVRSEESNREIEGESEEPRPTELTDDAVARRDFWSIQGDFICRHQTEPRVQLYVPKEETFPIPLKYIDVTRSTHTQLDVMQEKRIDDYWNVDHNRSLSDIWTFFTKLTLLKEELPQGYMWSAWRLTKVQTTARPDHMWREVWTNISKASQKRERQEWRTTKQSSRTRAE